MTGRNRCRRGWIDGDGGTRKRVIRGAADAIVDDPPVVIDDPLGR